MTKQKLLLIEDDGPVAEAFAALLSHHFDVETRDSVQEGISALVAGSYAVAVVDLCFPNDPEGGLRVIKYVVDNNVPTAAIVLTAVGKIETCRQALRAGVFDFVEKGQPWTNDRLLASTLEAAEAKKQITIDLSGENVEALDELRNAMGTDLIGVFREGVRILGWAIREWQADRRIASVKDSKYKLYPNLLKREG